MEQEINIKGNQKDSEEQRNISLIIPVSAVNNPKAEKITSITSCRNFSFDNLLLLIRLLVCCQ